ncbi:hypothetical protein [Streptomyces erythrochromogenes]|uniref:hypothetical protein n=1 Tax=Streptomyces erythrochromogenes TaxID=285574 RepID=UPI0036751B3E
MAETYYLWRLAEAAQQIDLLAGFLATRHAPGPDHLAEPAECAAAGRAAVAAGSLGQALDQVDALREHAARWAGHPHHPGEPGAAEHDARVWDYAKDALRAEHGPEAVHAATARDLLQQLRFLQREICALPEADAQARADAHYLAGRGAMAVELGRPGVARRELRRLRALAGRYTGTHVT